MSRDEATNSISRATGLHAAAVGLSSGSGKEGARPSKRRGGVGVDGWRRGGAGRQRARGKWEREWGGGGNRDNCTPVQANEVVRTTVRMRSMRAARSCFMRSASAALISWVSRLWVSAASCSRAATMSASGEAAQDTCTSGCSSTRLGAIGGMEGGTWVMSRGLCVRGVRACVPANACRRSGNGGRKLPHPPPMRATACVHYLGAPAPPAQPFASSGSCP